MRLIEFTHLYLKDLRLARKRGLPEAELNVIVEKLAKDEFLDPKYKDHPLKGSYFGFRECHIRPDWLLVYKKKDTENLSLLYLMRTGSHSDLF
ncbi:MAG: type II toxin-antitoxin system YafQ family toxin [Bacteroidales bacterium]|jgi:mRNA interferase YafQ|nr:type II toxin-antitoxin system YafQ family toxin [Bacteroidales bacterium]